jgi:hypothetical protein
MDHTDHEIVTATVEHAVYVHTAVKYIITEYRADGCVTWRTP